jgi:hypothetical protein
MNIEHQARRVLPAIAAQKRFPGEERFRPKARRPQQPRNRLANSRIIFYYRYHRLCGLHSCLSGSITDFPSPISENQPKLKATATSRILYLGLLYFG